jgi:hypothetical protein
MKRSGLRTSESGQVTVLGLLFLLTFVLLTAALVDIYTIFEARDWGYQVSQQAALAGVSVGRDWSGVTVPDGSCVGPGPVTLKTATAQNTAVDYLNREMALRGLSTYTYDVRVLPDYDGGSMSGYPPTPVRLGSGLGNWSTDEPAVAVFLSFPVSTFLLSLVSSGYSSDHLFVLHASYI